MAEKYNATCSICGRPYYKCISCKDTMALSPWKAFCDTAEHYKVHQVIRGFSSGLYTKSEAKTKFKNIDISDINGFRPHIKQIVEEILKEEPEKSVEDNLVKTLAETNEEVVEAPVYSRKRYFKTSEEAVEAE